VALWPDETLQERTGKAPKFPLAERLYFLNAVRYVSRVVPLVAPLPVNALPNLEGLRLQVWWTKSQKRTRAQSVLPTAEHSVLRVAGVADERFSRAAPIPSAPGRRRWSATLAATIGSLRPCAFHRRAQRRGDLYVIVGHDANIRPAQGRGTSLLSQENDGMSSVPSSFEAGAHLQRQRLAGRRPEIKQTSRMATS